MKLGYSLVILTLVGSAQALASGSPTIECTFDKVKVKKYDKEKHKYVTTNTKIGLYFGGLARLDEEEDPATHHPVSQEIMFQAVTKDQDVIDVAELNPANIDTVYGDYKFADAKGKELDNPTFDIDFTSNSGTKFEIHVQGKKAYGTMKGTAKLKASDHDRYRIENWYDQKDLNVDFGESFGDQDEDNKKDATIEQPITCNYSWG